jgi:hypothetical protein
MRAHQFTEDAVKLHKRNRYIRRLHKMTGWDTSHLELLSNDELRDLHIQHQTGDVDQPEDNHPVDEISNDLLSRYKKAASADASAADKRGDFERGNKRFKGIVKATVKQGDNDAKKHKEQGVAEGICEVCGTSLAEHGKASLKLCKSSRPDSELGASNLASCKSQGLRARDGDKSHLLGRGPESRVKVGGHKIKGKKYGGPLPDWS